MRRGDIVTVAVGGDYGKPRPAVVVQTDALPQRHASVIICQMTSKLIDRPEIRVTVEASDGNGLRVRSQIMVDKPTTVRIERLGAFIGRLNLAEIVRLNTAIAFVMGLAD